LTCAPIDHGNARLHRGQNDIGARDCFLGTADIGYVHIVLAAIILDQLLAVRGGRAENPRRFDVARLLHGIELRARFDAGAEQRDACRTRPRQPACRHRAGRAGA